MTDAHPSSYMLLRNCNNLQSADRGQAGRMPAPAMITIEMDKRRRHQISVSQSSGQQTTSYTFNVPVEKFCTKEIPKSDELTTKCNVSTATDNDCGYDNAADDDEAQQFTI